MKTVLCCVVYDGCAQLYAHTYEQFRFRFIFCVCLGSAFCVFFLA